MQKVLVAPTTLAVKLLSLDVAMVASSENCAWRGHDLHSRQMCLQAHLLNQQQGIDTDRVQIIKKILSAIVGD